MILHVGTPKSGTTFLQRAMWHHHAALKEQGFRCVGNRQKDAFLAAIDVRGSHEFWGYSEAHISGRWSAVCRQAREYDGTTIISHEVLAGANRQQIRTALEPLAGIDIHIVVTARDLGRQAVAHWQEEVKLGATYSFAEFEETQLRADTGPGPGPDDGGIRPHFWYAQDFADCLDRWAGRMGEGRAHLVPLPRPDVPPEELWVRFASAAGIVPSIIDTDHHAPANPSLGVAEIALLRAVNAELGDRLDRRTYLQLVKRDYAEATLARRPGPRPRTPYDLGELFEEKTARWLSQVESQDVVIHGDPGDLAPVLAGEDDPRPDDVEVVEDPVAIAAGLVPEPEHRNRRWRGPFHK